MHASETGKWGTERTWENILENLWFPSFCAHCSATSVFFPDFPDFILKGEKRKLAPDNWLPHHPHCFISLRAEFSHDSHNRTTRKDRAMINFFNTLQILRSAKLVRISLPIIALPNCFIFNETKVSEYQRIEWVRRCSRFLAPVWNRTQSLLPAFY